MDFFVSAVKIILFILIIFAVGGPFFLLASFFWRLAVSPNEEKEKYFTELGARYFLKVPRWLAMVFLVLIPSIIVAFVIYGVRHSVGYERKVAKKALEKFPSEKPVSQPLLRKDASLDMAKELSLNNYFSKHIKNENQRRKETRET